MKYFMLGFLACVAWAADDKSSPIPHGDEVNGEVAPAPAPRVTVYSIPRCTFCARLRRDVKGDVRDREWRFVDDWRKHPDWIKGKLAEGEGYPFVVWKNGRGHLVYTSGWSGLARWLKQWDLSQRVSVPAPKAPPKRNQTPGAPLVPMPDNTPLPPAPTEPSPSPPELKS